MDADHSTSSHISTSGCLGGRSGTRLSPLIVWRFKHLGSDGEKYLYFLLVPTPILPHLHLVAFFPPFHCNARRPFVA